MAGSRFGRRLRKTELTGGTEHGSDQEDDFRHSNFCNALLHDGLRQRACGDGSCGSGIGRSGPNMKALAGSGTWLDGKRFGANVSEAELKSWIEGLK